MARAQQLGARAAPLPASPSRSMSNLDACAHSRAFGARAVSATLALLALLGLAACGASGVGPDSGEAVSALVLSGAPAGPFLVGQTAQLLATPLNGSGAVISNGKVQWSSSDQAVATVSPSGLVAAVGGGQATITAKSGSAEASSMVSVYFGAPMGVDGATASVLNNTVTLVVPPQSLQNTTTILFLRTPAPPSDPRLVPGTAVTIGPENLSFFRGATLKLKYDKTKLPANVTQASLQLYAYIGGSWWRISGSSVDSTTQIVSGTIQTSGIYAVVGTPVARLAINPSRSVIFADGKAQLGFTAYDADDVVQAGRVAAWSSSNTAVATVDATGKVTGVSAGVATITATIDGVTATSQVDVFARAVDPGPGGATHPTGILASTLGLSGRPHGVAIASSGQFCVSRIDAASVSCGIVSTTAAALGASTAVDAAPAHVALSADGTRAYTANQYGNSLSIVDVATSTLVGTVPLSNGGFNVLADPGSSRVYVTTATGALHVVDATTQSVLTQVATGPASNGLALDRAAGLLYVSSITAGTVAVVNTTTNTVVKTYPVSPKPQRIALSADGATLYVASESAGLEIVTVATGATVAVPAVFSGAVGLALSPDGQKVYVTNPPLGYLQIVDVATKQVTTLNGLATPRNVAFGLGGAVALVTGEGGLVYVIR